MCDDSLEAKLEAKKARASALRRASRRRAKQREREANGQPLRDYDALDANKLIDPKRRRLDATNQLSNRASCRRFRATMGASKKVWQLVWLRAIHVIVLILGWRSGWHPLCEG
jgi:hypothetical protein